jgi:chemotaxis protein MotB
MFKWFLTILLLIVAALGAGYWWLYRPQGERLAAAVEQKDAAATQIALLKNEIADLQTVRAELSKASTQLKEQVAAKEAELASLRSTQDELIGELKQEIADKQVEVERVRDKLRVEMVDEVLFDSGEAALKPAGIAVLKKIGGVLARAERGIEIQGHTDNVPIRGALTQRFPTNWELSAARAINVARFLEKEAGVKSARLSASAFAENQPRGPNDTPESRRKNRRIEILLVPLDAAQKPATAEPAKEPGVPAPSPTDQPQKAGT